MTSYRWRILISPVYFLNSVKVHDVEFCHNLRQVAEVTIPALLEMKARAKVRYIGLTGYSLDTITRLVDLLPPGQAATLYP